MMKVSSLLLVFLLAIPSLELRAQNNSDLYDYFLSRPLNIEANSKFARIKLQIDYQVQNAPQINFRQMLSNLLLYSGVFDTHAPPHSADLVLNIKDSIFFGAEAVFKTLDDRALYSGLIAYSNDNRQLRQNIIKLIDDAIQKIDGQKSLFSSAILYSRKRLGDLGSSIVLTDFLGEKRYILINNQNINMLPAWSPDGSKFLYTSLGRFGSRVYVFDLHKFVISPLSGRSSNTTGGHWLPNGDEIIVTRTVNGRPALHLYNLVTEQWTKLIGGSYISTSADTHSDRLLFTSNRSRGVQIFFKQNYLQSGLEYRMTFLGGNNSEPRWSHHGSLFSYSSLRNGVFQIFLMNEDGRTLRQVTSGNYNAEQAVWAADDRQLLYTSFEFGGARLKFTSLDGKFHRYLHNIKTTAKESNPAWSNNFDWRLITRYLNRSQQP